MANKNKTVVCIEDEPEMIDLVRLILGRKGFELIGAVGGREGLQKVREVKPDLVLLDLMMPEVDGFTVLSTMKEEPEIADIPVIVITAKELSSQERRRLSGHVESLLQKGSYMDLEMLDDIVDVLS